MVLVWSHESIPSTWQQLVKVPQVPCLYRHSLSERYYGIKKLGGKRKARTLPTSYGCVISSGRTAASNSSPVR
jgi:hypothetical protein